MSALDGDVEMELAAAGVRPELIAQFKQWKGEHQQRAMTMLRQFETHNWHPFFCKRQGCDGGTHPDGSWDWPHARADQRPPSMDSPDWLTLLFSGGRGAGKAVSYDTPLPTPLTCDLSGPTGWVTMKEVAVGTRLLDEQGEPCRVTAVFDVLPDTAYRLTFSDGTQVTACGDHQWVTLDALERKRLNRRGGGIPTDWATGSPITTTALVETLTHGGRGDRNHAIPTTEPLMLPEAPLLVDPWVLGYWLGNGSTLDGSISTHPDDEEHVRARMSGGGYLCGLDYNRRTDRAPTFTPRGLAVNLRTIGVLGDKHLPVEYLRSSEHQRRELMSGLLDSDGYISRTGLVEFCSTSRRLAEGFTELARTLGQKPVCTEGRARLYGVDKGPKWRVTFRPTVQPFASRRKAAGFRPLGAQAMRSAQRMIVSAEAVAPEPMRCVTVDSPHSMYLIGDGMIPTHNSRTGSEITHKMTERVSRLILIGATGPDLRDTMVEGVSGILATSPPGKRPLWEPSKKRLSWPNGAIGQGFSAEEPDRLRGPEGGFSWLDEPAHYALIDDVWSNMLLGLRLGRNPKVVATTTPKPTKWMKAQVKDPLTITRRVSTYANIGNLADAFKRTVLDRFEGTRLGRQELHGEILEDVEGALWTWDMFSWVDEAPPLLRIVVGVDPAGTKNKSSDETGLVVCGIGYDKHLYVLADLTARYTPRGWATRANEAYEQYGADAIVAEKNYGGDMVRHTLETSGYGGARIILVDSRRGKEIRAEPIVARYEKSMVSHVGEQGTLAELEDEQTSWVPGVSPSPNRIDSLVHGATHLLKNLEPAAIANPNRLLRRNSTSGARHLRAV